MTNKRLVVSPVILMLLLILLSGCGTGLRSETIVIPNREEDQLSNQSSQLFQVKTIYRLPISSIDNVQVLGWGDADTLVALFKDTKPSEHLTQQLKLLSPPYETFKMSHSFDLNMDFSELSPDGRYIPEITKSQEGYLLKLISLADGKEKIIATINSSQQQLLSPDLIWSDNSRYVSYMITDSAREQTASIGVYDTVEGETKLYSLAGLNTPFSLATVKMSDDGSSALIVMVQSSRDSSIAMGKLNGSELSIQYEHRTGGDQAAWLNNDQFVFLGEGGALYEYDYRNGELSVLIEGVMSFQLSRDRKYLAYSKNENYAIFAGKIQGNNVLYAKSVYQGVIPSQMYWSPDNDSLLIGGRKLYESPQKNLVEPASDNRPFIIQFQ